VVEQITLSRVTATQDPAVVGRLATLIGQTTAQVNATIADPRYSLYKPVPVLTGGRHRPNSSRSSPTSCTSKSTSRSSPASARWPPPSASTPRRAARTGRRRYPASQTLGYVGTINAAELKSRASQGYVAGDPFGQSGLEYQYEAQLRGTSGQQQLEVNPKGQVVGSLRTTLAVPGDNLVTNLDTNLQQVADNALASQILALRRTYDTSATTTRGATRRPPAARWS